MKKFKFSFVSYGVRCTEIIKAANETEAWIIFKNHITNAEQIKCQEVKPRVSFAKMRDEAMASLGMTKVRGAVSGKTYWE